MSLDRYVNMNNSIPKLKENITLLIIKSQIYDLLQIISVED